jgi:hypothetical protein
MPALVCIYCRTTWRLGTVPVSHGICPGCLLATDPEAYAEIYGHGPLVSSQAPAALEATVPAGADRMPR